MAKLKHEGRDLPLERDVPFLTPAMIMAHLEKKKLLAEGRRVVIRQGPEMRPLDQFPPDKPLAGDTIESKSIPGGTVKGQVHIHKREALR
jgi:hypothetical protein